MSKDKNSDSKNEISASLLPKEVLVIPILNSPIYPGMIAPIILSEDKFTSDLDEHLGKHGYVALNLVKYKDAKPGRKLDVAETGSMIEVVDGDEEVDPDSTMIDQEVSDSRVKSIGPISDRGMEAFSDTVPVSGKDVYKVGIFAKVVKKIKLPDGSVNLLVHGLKRYRVKSFITNKPLLIAQAEVYEDVLNPDEELDAYTRSVINQVKKLSEINPYFNEEMKLAMLNSPSPGALADLVAFALSLDVPEAQDFLETLVVKKRFAKLLVYLKREKDVADIQKKITDEVNDKVNKYQREYYLREQLKIIRQNLAISKNLKMN